MAAWSDHERREADRRTQEDRRRAARREADQRQADTAHAMAAPPTAEVVLHLTRAEAELLDAVLDFGGIDNDNLPDADRDTCQRIAERLHDGEARQ